MRRFWGALRVELRRGFISPAFIFAVLGTTALLYLGVIDELKLSLKFQSVYQMVMGAWFCPTFTAILVISVVPLGVSFCSDVGCQFLRPHCIRSGIGCYSAGKVIAVALSGGAATFLGYLLFYASLAVRMPFVRVTQITLADYFKSAPFSNILIGGHYLTFLLYTALLAFAMSALFSTLALFCSSFLPNIFVTLFSPALLWYLIDYATSWIRSSIPFLYPLFIYRGRAFGYYGAPCILYAFLYTAVICAILGFFINKNVRRRLQHV